MTNLEDLLELDRLKRIAKRSSNSSDTTQLENDFLEFSAYSPKKELTVKLPKLFKLQGDQAQKVATALTSIGAPITKLPEAIDISGCFDYNQLTEALVFLSLQQVEADHYSSYRSYLNPLIENIYIEGGSLIRDFSIHEPLTGKVVCKRGDLNLREAHLFPDKFTTGPYRLVVELDTPAKTVKKFVNLSERLKKIKGLPKESLLNPASVEEVTAKAVELRKVLGSLSRYENPETQTFKAVTNSCVIRTKNNTLFYLYAPKHNQNILVYFGDTPFALGNEPKDLLVLSGNDHQYTILGLLELDIFETSGTVLSQRIKDITNLYESAAKGLGKTLSGEYPRFEQLLEGLKKSETYFNEVVNPEIRKKYATTISPELLEFMICPASDEPTIHELLPRLSWNKTLRTYHNTEKFMSLYENADDARKKETLKEVTSNMLFNNQQNNDVNVWLYINHRQFCTDLGIEFAMIS